MVIHRLTDSSAVLTMKLDNNFELTVKLCGICFSYYLYFLLNLFHKLIVFFQCICLFYLLIFLNVYFLSACKVLMLITLIEKEINKKLPSAFRVE